MISNAPSAAGPGRWFQNPVLSIGMVALTLCLAVASGCSKQEATAVTSSIAVLPLANSTDEADNEYFACGVTEALISRLGRVAALDVISWPSVMKLNTGDIPMEQVARDLDVQAVVTGSVLQAGDSVRIAVQFTDVATGRTASSSAAGVFADIGALENTIASDLVAASGVKPTAEESSRLAEAATVTPEAYRLYLRGRFVANQRRLEALQKSIDYFSRAIAADPGFAPAYAALADTYIAMGDRGFVVPTEAFPPAEEAAKKAFEIDPSLPEALSALAYLNFVYDWKWEEAKKQFEQALMLDPGNSVTLRRYAQLLDAMGLLADAMAQLGRATDLDPQNPDTNRLRGRFMLVSPTLRTHEFLKRSTELDSDNPEAYIDLGRWEFFHQNYLNAVNAFSEAYRLAGWNERDVAKLREAYDESGASGLITARAKLVEKMSHDPSVMPLDGFFGVAEGLAMTPDRDGTIAALKKYREAHGPRLVLLNVDPYFRRCRSDSSFVAFMNDVGFDVEVTGEMFGAEEEIQ